MNDSMSDNTWVHVLNESQLEEGAIHQVTPKGLSIILMKKDGHVFAMRNRCAHMACTLAGGRREGYTLQCPCHEWKFDIRTGEFLGAREITVPVYECRSQEGGVFIKLEAL